MTPFPNDIFILDVPIKYVIKISAKSKKQWGASSCSLKHHQQAAPAAVKILGGDCGPDIEKLNLILIATMGAHSRIYS